MSSIEAVFCLRTTGSYSYENNIELSNLFFATVSHQWNSDEPVAVNVVMRPDEIESAKSLLLTWPNIHFTFIDENDLLPGITESAFGGWTKQQLLKFAIAQVIQSEFYITYDPDLFACRPIGPDSFIHDGKAVSGWEYKRYHPAWWQGAARTLLLPEVEDELVLSVTPNVLSKTIALGLIEHLNSITDNRWWEYLVSVHSQLGVETWTEYALYFTFAKAAKLFDKFHCDPDTCKTYPRLISPNSVWHKSQIPNWDLANSFGENPDAFFTVCQSTVGVKPMMLFQSIKQYLPSDVADRLEAALSLENK